MNFEQKDETYSNSIFKKKKVEKRPNKGWSVVCRVEIEKGQFVCEYVGEIISTSEAKLRQTSYDRKGLNYLLIIKEYMYL